ncbi:dienelactone hydrolase family protein [Rhodococcus sp. NPDC056960]|uniref:dienelactone hydrolase family protein n=1 Tax=Rhodococcus sp. NPDC056960 TaxID=3345982 RepID=UPI0036401E71
MEKGSAPTPAYVLVLPGGKPRSTEPSRFWHLSNLRMAWMARSLRSTLGRHGIAVDRLQYRVRGWNAPENSPVHDARIALERARLRLGDVPVAVVGHSMGGRVAAHLAALDNVRAVAALAPWWPESDGNLVPPDRSLMVAHGTADRWTNPTSSRLQTEQALARGVNASWTPLPGAGHFMLTRPRWWHRITADFVLDAFAAEGVVPASTDQKAGRNA